MKTFKELAEGCPWREGVERITYTSYYCGVMEHIIDRKDTVCCEDNCAPAHIIKHSIQIFKDELKGES